MGNKHGIKPGEGILLCDFVVQYNNRDFDIPEEEAVAIKMGNLCVDYDHFNPDDPSMVAIAKELAMISAKVNIQDFRILKVLGRGSYGKVTLIQHKEEGDLFALKTLRKRKVIKTSQVEHTKSERK